MLFILDKSYDVVGSLNSDGDLSKITTYFDDSYVQELSTGAETFQFSTLSNSYESQHLVVGNFIAFKEYGDFKLFNIVHIEETHEDVFIKTVYCEMASVELINEIIRPVKISNCSLRKFLDTILESTEWQLGKIDAGFTQLHDFEITDYKSTYSLIQEYVIGVYGAEISYRVEIEHGRVTGKYIDCYKEKGNSEGFRFSYGSNLTSVTRTVDSSNLATALIGVGNNGITFKEVDTEDKPPNQDFIVNEAAYEQWNINGSHIFGTHKADTDSPQELLRLTRIALAERANPQIKYEMKAELLDRKVKIGDTVNVVDHEFNPPLYLSARVNKLTKSKTNPYNDEVVLANFKELRSNITEEMRALASQLEGYVDSQFPIGGDKIQNGAIGKEQFSKTYHTEIVADAVYASIVETEELIAGKANIGDLEAVNARVENLQADKADITELNAIKGNITVLESEVAEIGSLKSDIADIEHILAGNITADNIASGTITSGSGIIAEGAIGNAQISSLDASKLTAGTIDTSDITIAGANQNLRITGNRLQVFEGVGASQKERVSLGDVNADGSVYGIRVRGKDGTTVLFDDNGVTKEGITDGSITNDKINPSANIDGSKLNINSVINRINSDGSTTIQGNRISIDNKSLSSVISEINTKNTAQDSTIASQASSITANTNAIKLKVDTQTYTTDKTNMTSKLDKATSEISTMKNQIALKVEQSHINNAVNSLNNTIDSKISSAKSEIKATTDSITNRVSKTETNVTNVTNNLNNLQIGGRNLLRNSEMPTLTAYSGATVDRLGEVAVTEWKFNGVQYSISGGTHLIVATRGIGRAGDDGLPYRLSVYIRNDGDTSFILASNGGSEQEIPVGFNGRVILQYVGSKSYIQYNFKRKSLGDTLKFTVARCHIEQGNKPTDWTPAPEDIQSQIDGTVNLVNTTKSEILQTTDSITNKVEKVVENLSSNLLLNSNFTDSTKKDNYWSNWQVDELYLQGNIVGFPVGEGIGIRSNQHEGCTINSHDVQAKTGDTFTVSGTYRMERNVGLMKVMIRAYQDNYTTWHDYFVDIANDKQDKVRTFSETFKIQVENVHAVRVILWNVTPTTISDSKRIFFNRIKLERGDTKTDWSDHPLKYSHYTKSEVQQKVDSVEYKFRQSGGSNLLYNSNFANKRHDKWFFANGGRQYTDYSIGYYDTDGCMVLQCMDGTNFHFGQEVWGLKGNTKYTFSVKLKKEHNTRGARLYIDFYDANNNWCPAGADLGNFAEFEINGYREYKTFTTPPNAVRGNVFIEHLGTQSGGSEYSLLWTYHPCLTEGESHAGWSPHPNELYDGITKIDKDGMTVRNTSANTYTQIDAGSFSVNNNNGATIAEFSQNSNIPILTAGHITADTVKANNLATSSGNKSWSGRTYYVQGTTGVDAEGRGTSWGNAFRSVQYVLDNYIEDILNDNVSIHVGSSVQGWNCYGRSGRGTLQFYLENDAVVSTEVVIQGCTIFVRVIGTNDRKGTLKRGIVAHNCSFVDIGWLTFRGENWWHGSGSCNVLFSDFTRGIVRMCDFNGVAFGVIVDLGSHMWLFNNRGSNISHYVGISAYTRVSLARYGSDTCPDYSGYMYGNANHANLYTIEDGATFTKTPSVGWSPSYTPTQRTSTWNFNKIWSDETLHGWSDRNELIQGYSSAYDTGRWTGYLQMTDGMSAIRSTISGGTNLSGRVYVQRRTSSGAGTGTCCMYASDGTHIANISMARGAGAWFTLNSSVVNKIMNGSITYFYLKNDSNNINTYMKMETLGKIEITYTK